MSRSVETVGNNVIYFDVSDYDPDFGWLDLIDNLQSDLCQHYPSFVKTKNKWVQYPYRENRIILENQFVSVSISEYCGCAAISVFVREDLNSYICRDDTDLAERWLDLAEHWLKQCYPGIKKVVQQYVTSMHKVATFSNGEVVYELDEKPRGKK